MTQKGLLLSGKNRRHDCVQQVFQVLIVLIISRSLRIKYDTVVAVYSLFYSYLLVLQMQNVCGSTRLHSFCREMLLKRNLRFWPSIKRDVFVSVATQLQGKNSHHALIYSVHWKGFLKSHVWGHNKITQIWA